MATGQANNPDLRASALFDVSHVTAVVTGGATGIGLMITQALQSNGAKVYITGRRQEVLDKTVELYSHGPGQIIALPGDVSKKSEAVRLAKEIGDREPRGIQLLVNNAGIARDDDTRYAGGEGQPDMSDARAVSEHFLRSTEEQWTETMRTNVMGAYFMSVAFLPLLAKGREATPGYSSQVVNVSSISGAMKGPSMGQPAYATSKAAATHLSRMLATIFKDVKVRVNVIAPGLFPSEMTAGGKSGEDNKSTLSMKATNPSGRLGGRAIWRRRFCSWRGGAGCFTMGRLCIRMEVSLAD
ncbi:hypothetical protein PG985_016153 [Apiospora marii]|uniref:uncharacterized protein n=1 Tax=Apiospora marii TaxID=335849 RepID=UPI00313014DA